MDMFTGALVSEDDLGRFETVLGPFAVSVLKRNPKLLVVSGSIVLDSLNATSFAKDIDIFCVEAQAIEICDQAVDCGLVVNKYVREAYTIGAFDRYQILGPKQIDIVVCSSPLESVAKFDLLHNKVAFDGQRVWTHRNWIPEKITVMRYAHTLVDRFFANLAKWDSDRLYEKASENYNVDYLRTIIRAGKYHNRGYEIFDRHKVLIPFDTNRLSMLEVLAGQKPEYQTRPYSETSRSPACSLTTCSSTKTSSSAKSKTTTKRLLQPE